MTSLPIRIFLVCAALALFPQCASAKELVAEFSGQANDTTREFEVEAPWIIDWLIAGNPARFDAVDVSLYNAKTGGFEGVVLKTKSAGDGVRLFKQSGRYYMRVNASMMNWHLRVFHLTEDEAKAYKPKSKSILDG
jgi:hypothetical protein